MKLSILFPPNQSSNSTTLSLGACSELFYTSTHFRLFQTRTTIVKIKMTVHIPAHSSLSFSPTYYHLPSLTIILLYLNWNLKVAIATQLNKPGGNVADLPLCMAFFIRCTKTSMTLSSHPGPASLLDTSRNNKRQANGSSI